jgi:hypothetical protein
VSDTCVMPLPPKTKTLAPRSCCVLVQSLNRKDIRMLTSSRPWLTVEDRKVSQRKVKAVTTPMIIITGSAISDACIDAFKRTGIIFLLNLRIRLYGQFSYVWFESFVS